MNDNEFLVDEKIKKRLREEINHVPETVHESIIETSKNLSSKRKPLMRLKYAVAAVLIAVIGFTALGIANPTYAQNIPVIGQFFKSIDKVLYSKYDNFSTDLNMSKSSDGYKITIHKVAYDGMYLTLAYNLDSDEPIKFEPNGILVNLKVNGKDTSKLSTAVLHGEFSKDKRSYSGIVENLLSNPSAESNDIPDKFNLEIDINKIFESNGNNEVNGTWNFSTQVVSEKVKGNVQEISSNINLDKLEKDMKIDKVIITPLNTVLHITNTSGSSDIGYIVYDDKGRILPPKVVGLLNNNDMTSYKLMSYKEVYDDSKTLTIIPYNFNETDETLSKIVSADLNPKGETNVSLGKYGDLKITKVETIDGITKLYYKSPFGSIIIPQVIKDKKTGEIIYITKRPEYIEDTSEYAATFNKAIGNEDYSVQCNGNPMIYTDMKSKINIK